MNTHNPTDYSRMIDAVEAALRVAKPISISRHDETIHFRAGLFRFVHNWNPLVAIGSGELLFSQHGSRVEILYRISFVQLFIAVTVMVAIMFDVLPRVSGMGKVPLGILAVFWAWLFGANYVTTLFRFPRFVRTAAERVIQSTEFQ